MPRERRRESGIILFLTMFIVLLLLVIVPQFRFSAAVERELALTDAMELQMEQLARAAIMRAEAALLLDLEEDKSGEEGDDPLGGGGGSGGEGFGGSGEGGSPGGAPPDSGAGGVHVDSLEESWATGQIDFTLGQEAEFETRIVISDEDSKLNVLLLCAEEEEYRREWRGRFERCLDLMRDGQAEDLSASEAGELLDRVEGWIHGERSTDELSDPPLRSGDWQGLLGRKSHAPLSLAELAMAGGISPKLLDGFLSGEEEGEEEHRRWLPGLRQVLTVWSNLEYREASEDESKESAPDASGKKTPRTETAGCNNGRVNVNTAPVWVLKSLFADSDVPYSAWDEYDEFRREELEEIRKKREERRSGFGDDREEEDPGERSDGEDGPAKYPFKSIDDLRKVDGFSPNSSSMAPAEWDKLASLLTVESNVFTITVMIASVQPPRRWYVARSVVWRRSQGRTSGSGQAECLPLLAFERVPTSTVDLQAFAKELDEEYGEIGE